MSKPWSDVKAITFHNGKAVERGQWGPWTRYGGDNVFFVDVRICVPIEYLETDKHDELSDYKKDIPRAIASALESKGLDLGIGLMSGDYDI